MDLSLAGLTYSALNARSWNSSGEVLEARVRDAARLAAAEMVSRVPTALAPDEDHVVVYASQRSVDSGVAALIETTVDPWVLRLTDRNSVALGHPLSATTWRPAVDRTWDGRMHLELQAPDGRWRRRQSRSWWSVPQLDGGSEWYVSVDRPVDWTAPDGMEFRVHQPEFFPRADVHQVLSPARIWSDGREHIVQVEPGTAIREGWTDDQGRTTGIPTILRRGRSFQMPAPHRAPDVEARWLASTWAGPWQEGAYKFRYTICWGMRDGEWGYLPGGLREPLWESAPSEESARFDHLADIGAGIAVMFPNIEAHQNFADPATLRYGRSGWFLRLYVAQFAAYPAGAGVGAYSRVETSGVYYPLADVGLSGVAPEFLWRGVEIPDRQRPLKHATRYFGWHLHPVPDQRCEIDLRTLRSPPSFVHATDTFPLHEAFHPAFFHLFLSYLCLADGVDTKTSVLHRTIFQTMVDEVLAVEGSGGGIVEPVPFVSRGWWGE